MQCVGNNSQHVVDEKFDDLSIALPAFEFTQINSSAIAYIYTYKKTYTITVTASRRGKTIEWQKNEYCMSMLIFPFDIVHLESQYVLCHVAHGTCQIM